MIDKMIVEEFVKEHGHTKSNFEMSMWWSANRPHHTWVLTPMELLWVTRQTNSMSDLEVGNYAYSDDYPSDNVASLMSCLKNVDGKTRVERDLQEDAFLYMMENVPRFAKLCEVDW